MSEPFIGQIIMFGGNFAPRGWAFCNGQLLSISQNTALFSILGTTFGGNGQTTFALPDLRGRVPLHPGQGPGLSNYTLGESSGVENTTLLNSQMPAHTHSLAASTANANQPQPTGNVLAAAIDSQGGTGLTYTATPNTTMAPTAIGSTGGSQPFSVMQPFLGINFIIALEGIYPSRN